MPAQFGEPPGTPKSDTGALRSESIDRTPLSDTTPALPTTVRPVGTGELSNTLLQDRRQPHSDIVINQMRDHLLVQRDNPLMEGTALQTLPDEVLENETFLNLVVTEHRQAVSNQLLIAERIGIKIDPRSLRAMTLPDAVRRSLNEIEQDTRYKELAKKMMTDELTGLRNRTYYAGPLRDKVEHAIATGEEVAEVAVDIDFFKKINDNFTHDAGDETLQKGARLLDGISQFFRPGSYYVCRIGGDEVRLVFIGAPQARVIEGLKTIREMTEQHLRDYPVEGRPHTSFSMGVSFSNQRRKITHKLLASEADFAAYDAKEQGKDNYWVYREGLEKQSEMPDELKKRMEKNRAEAAAIFADVAA